MTVVDLNPGIDYAMLPNPAGSGHCARATGRAGYRCGWHRTPGWPRSDRIAWPKSCSDGTIATRVDLRSAGEGSRRMRGPRGLAWDESRSRLYVFNKLANIAEPHRYSARGLWWPRSPRAATIPCLSAIKEGRGFLFDARLSGNGTMSCASCHLDADRDGLAWDLGDPAGKWSWSKGRTFPFMTRRRATA